MVKLFLFLEILINLKINFIFLYVLLKGREEIKRKR